MSRFPLVDRYLGIQLDIPVCEMLPGETRIVESTRRLRCEQSYGYVHALFGIWFIDGRVAVSVPPGAGRNMEDVLMQTEGANPSNALEWIEQMSAGINSSLARAGLPLIQKSYEGRQFACNASTLRSWNEGDCRRLGDERIPPA